MNAVGFPRVVLVAALAALALTPLVAAPGLAGAVTSPPAGSYVVLAPARLLDTRSAVGVTTTTPVPTNGTVTLQVAGRGGVPTGISAVALNVTVTAPTGPGFVTVYADGNAKPTASNLNYITAQAIPNLVIAPVGIDGKVDLSVSRSTHLVADVFGYYRAGSPVAAGAFGSLQPARILDTRSAIGVSTTTPVPTNGKLTLQVAGRGGVPASGVSAVTLNVTVAAPGGPGLVTVFADGATKPGTSNLNYVKGETISNLVIAPVGADGKLDLTVTSSTHLVADVSGYFLGVSPALTGTFGSLQPMRLLDTRSAVGVSTTTPVPTNGKLTLQVAGRGGVPASGVSAVTLNVTVTAPSGPGLVTVFADGATKPGTSNLNYVKGETISNLVIAPVGADGKLDLTVTSSAHLVADVSGFIRSTDIGVAQISTSRYVRNLAGLGHNDSGNVATMTTEGCRDATDNGSTGDHLMLLDIGAQSITSPLSASDPGAALSATSPVIRLDHSELVTAVNGYTDGYASCRSGTSTSTIVIGTNNDGDWSGYAAAPRASDWASKVIEPLRVHAAAHVGIAIVSGIDIEAGFASTEAQAETWITDYFLGTSAPLVENGSADACPTAFGTVSVACGPVKDDNSITKTWTQAQYYRLAHGLSPTRILALPQIYGTDQAAQWANIDQTGATVSDRMAVIGSVTEFAACAPQSATCVSLAPTDGFAALWNALATSSRTSPALNVATDLRSDT